MYLKLSTVYSLASKFEMSRKSKCSTSVSIHQHQREETELDMSVLEESMILSNQNVPPPPLSVYDIPFDEFSDESTQPVMKKCKSKTLPRQRLTKKKSSHGVNLDLKTMYGLTVADISEAELDRHDFKNPSFKLKHPKSPLLMVQTSCPKRPQNMSPSKYAQETIYANANDVLKDHRKNDILEGPESRNEYQDDYTAYSSSTANQQIKRAMRSDQSSAISPSKVSRPGYSKNVVRLTPQTNKMSPSQIVTGISKLTLPSEEHETKKEAEEIYSGAGFDTDTGGDQDRKEKERYNGNFRKSVPLSFTIPPEDIESKRKRRNLRALNVQNIFSYIYEKGAEADAMAPHLFLPTMQFIAAFMREDSTFLIVHEEMNRIRASEFLLRTEETDALLKLILEKVRLSIEMEYVKMRSVWEQAINTLR